MTHRSSIPGAPKRVVILGGSGFIGEAVAARLTVGGVPVVPLASADLNLSAASAVQQLSALLRPDDALVFASAITREKGRDAATMMRNLAMAQHVVEAFQHTPCAHVVYLSSGAVYGDDAPNPVTEETPCRPADLYGVMHLAREGMMRHVCSTTGTPLAILRPSIVYGPGDTHGSYGPNKWFGALRAGEDIIIFGGGEERRDHVFIDDVVSLIEAVLRHRSEGVLNLVTGTSPSFADVAREFGEVTGVTRTTSRPRSVPVTHRTYDAAAVRMAFSGFVPTPVHEGLRRTWTAQAEHQ